MTTTLLEKERPHYGFASERENPDPEGAARRVTEQVREIDPEALAVTRWRRQDILEYVEFPEAR